MILLEFGGMSPEGMVNLAEHDNTPGNTPTSLRRWVSEFLSNTADRDHIVGIGFLSRGAMTKPSANVVTSTGSAYVFPRWESSYWTPRSAAYRPTEHARLGAGSSVEGYQ